MECRYDLSSLDTPHPSLGKRFKELQEAYRQANELAKVFTFIKPVGVATRATATDAMDPYHLRLSRIKNRIRIILVEIRSHNEFKHLILTTYLADDWREGDLRGGYIIAINASQIRSDAFLIHDGQVPLLQLEDLDYSELCNRDSDLRDALDEQSRDPTTAKRGIG